MRHLLEMDPVTEPTLASGKCKAQTRAPRGPVHSTPVPKWTQPFRDSHTPKQLGEKDKGNHTSTRGRRILTPKPFLAREKTNPKPEQLNR
ncbi:hypothetical protein U1Q18_052637 [Sarracenia purpurea var. burkii]